MIIYEYRPPQSVPAERLFLLLAVLLSSALLLWGERSDSAVLRIAATVILFGAVLACARIALVSYSYTLERTDAGTADLVIYEVRRRSSAAVCRVSVSGARVARGRGTRGQKKGKIFNYCPGLFGTGCVLFFPTEEDGGGTILFSPDSEMLELMRTCGASDDSPEL